MKTQRLPILFAVMIIGAIVLAVTLSITRTYGSVTVDQPTVSNTYKTYQLFASTTAETTIATSTSQATSSNITAYFDSSGRYIDGTVDLRGAKKVTFYFTRGDVLGSGNTGTSTFQVQVTPDRSTWYYFSKLVAATSTTVSNAAVLSAPTIIAATSTLIYSMDLSNETYLAARCIATRLTDGSSICMASVQY